MAPRRLQKGTQAARKWGKQFEDLITCEKSNTRKRFSSYINVLNDIWYHPMRCNGKILDRVDNINGPFGLRKREGESNRVNLVQN